jgi:hypothetical protein
MDNIQTKERRLISRILFATVAIVAVVLLAVVVGVVRTARRQVALAQAILSRYDDSTIYASYEPYAYSPPPLIGGLIYERGGLRVLGSFSVTGEKPFWTDWVATIVGDKLFAGIYKVVIHDKRFSDADMPMLHELPGLRELDLSRTGITDHGVALVTNNSKLVKLDWSRTQITDHSLQVFDKLPELRELDISGTRTTKDAVQSFRKRHPRCLVIGWDE